MKRYLLQTAAMLVIIRVVVGMQAETSTDGKSELLVKLLTSSQLTNEFENVSVEAADRLLCPIDIRSRRGSSGDNGRG